MFQWGLACCAIEMGAALASPRGRRHAPRGHPVPGEPRQADLICVSGTVTDKMAPAVRRSTTDARPEVRDLDGLVCQLRRPVLGLYSVTKGIDQIVPVDVYVPGCPPRPEALIQGIVLLQERIQNEGIGNHELGEQRRRGEPIVVE